MAFAAAESVTGFASFVMRRKADAVMIFRASSQLLQPILKAVCVNLSPVRANPAPDATHHL
ncbi:hypothetical protein [Ralstonia pseudosolanacearum]|uniref:hypothetical protein n=1 Tax=Ralstonia pseudosolanacearum TaxID=1310165 RepID=UPI003CE76FB2